jgi:uncharacterized protein GlcG (DUF336 family)
MSAITVEIAQSMAAHVLAGAKEAGVPGISLVIIDHSTGVRLAIRTEEASLFGFEIARAKALSALSFKSPTLAQADSFGKNLALVSALSAATDGRFMPVGGGVPIFDERGKLVGAGAVAGSTPDVDHRLMSEAIVASGLRDRR